MMHVSFLAMPRPSSRTWAGVIAIIGCARKKKTRAHERLVRAFESTRLPDGGDQILLRLIMFVTYATY